MNSSSAAILKCREEAAVEPSTDLSFYSLSFAAGRLVTVCLLLVVVGVLVCYSGVTHNGFMGYDDDGYVTNNSHVRAGLTWNTVKWAFTTYEQANWHPLTWLSHALDCQLFGLNPAGHHYVNVLLHAVNVVLLFLLLRAATGFRWRSLMVAALFALHPVNVESVAWAAERKNVLSMMFFLLAFLAYGWYARRRAVRRYLLVGFLFALALMAKPQVITFPLLLLLWDYWPLGRLGGRTSSWAQDSHAPKEALIKYPQKAETTGYTGFHGGYQRLNQSFPKFSVGWLVWEKVPLFMLSAASAVVTMKAQRAGGALRNFSECSLLLRIETAVISYVSYLGKAFWPSNLVALYPHPINFFPSWQVAAAVFVIVVVTVWVIRSSHRPYLVVGWLWFLGSMVPMIGLVQVGAQAMADRYAYIPFIGLFVMVVWLVAGWGKTYRLPVPVLVLAAISCLLVLGILTYRQVSYWHDSESFWRRTLPLTHDNYYAEDNLGTVLFAEGKNDEAAGHFLAALAIRHDDMPATLNLGAYEQSRGDLRAAIQRYQTVATRAIDVDLRATAYGNLGSAYRQLGELALAKNCYETALQLTPDRTMAMIGLGLIAQNNGDLTEAVLQYSHAMAVQPTDVGFLLLAQALRQQGRSADAQAIYERVARLSPNFGEAQREMESLLAGR